MSNIYHAETSETSTGCMSTYRPALRGAAHGVSCLAFLFLPKKFCMNESEKIYRVRPSNEDIANLELQPVLMNF